MRFTFDGRRWRGSTPGWRRRRIVRTVLAAGVLVLAVLVVPSLPSTDPPEDAATGGPGSRGSAAGRFDVPPRYGSAHGWDVREVSDAYAVAQATGSIGTFQGAGRGRVLLRAVDASSGAVRWKGDPFKAVSDSWTRPRLLTAARAGREFFVVWAYGDAGTSVVSGARKVVTLDVYDAAHGTRRHVEVPWATAPDVAGGGRILIGRGSDHAAVVDPASGTVTQTAAKDLTYPKGCAACRRDTEIRGLTSHGLLVRGTREFWIRGGWYGRTAAPERTDPASGVPTSVTEARVLVKWHKKRGSKDADRLQTWAVHDTATGEVLASADCHRPAVEPGGYPQLAFSPSGRYAVAGPLAFDLQDGKGHCYDEPDRSDAPPPGAVDPDDRAADQGPRPLTLTTVTDQGTAYGTTAVHSAYGGRPLEVSLTSAAARALTPTAHLPVADLGGYGVFLYTDSKDVQHLVGCPRRRAPTG